MISIVACCHSVNLYAHAAQFFPSQQYLLVLYNHFLRIWLTHIAVMLGVMVRDYRNHEVPHRKTNTTTTHQQQATEQTT